MGTRLPGVTRTFQELPQVTGHLPDGYRTPRGDRDQFPVNSNQWSVTSDQIKMGVRNSEN